MGVRGHHPGSSPGVAHLKAEDKLAPFVKTLWRKTYKGSAATVSRECQVN